MAITISRDQWRSLVVVAKFKADAINDNEAHRYLLANDVSKKNITVGKSSVIYNITLSKIYKNAMLVIFSCLPSVEKDCQ